MSRRATGRSWGGGAVVVGILGMAVLAGYLAYVVENRYYLGGPVWLFPVGLLIMLLLSGGLLYGGHWLAGSDFDADDTWEATSWCFAGMIGALSLTFWPMFYQRVVGVAIRDPVFILVVSAGLGANAGLVIGVYDGRSQRRRAEVERSRDTLRFVNRLLRHNVLNATQIITGYAGLLLERSHPDDAEDYLRAIERQAEGITALVRNVDVLADHTADARRVRPMDLGALVADELDTLQLSYDGATIECDLPSGIEVTADELLAAAVRNVVENAIEHHDGDAPRVDVALTADDETAALCVVDDGPGIPPEQRERAFEPGEYADRGLGLYLARTLVDDLGGTVTLADNEPRGTRVTIELPLAS